MREILNFREKNLGRQCLTIVIAFLLLTISMATSIATNMENSSQKSSTEEFNNNENSLTYHFIFEKPTFQEKKLYNTGFTSIKMEKSLAVSFCPGTQRFFIH